MREAARLSAVARLNTSIPTQCTTRAVSCWMGKSRRNSIGRVTLTGLGGLASFGNRRQQFLLRRAEFFKTIFHQELIQVLAIDRFFQFIQDRGRGKVVDLPIES